MGDSENNSTKIFDNLKTYFKLFKLKCLELTPADLYHFMDLTLEYLAQHPIFTVTLLTILLTCIIPVLAFILFAGISIFVTFFLFFAVEGTLILFGFLALVTVILTLCAVLLMGLVTAGAAWFVFTQLFATLCNTFEDFAPHSLHHNERH